VKEESYYNNNLLHPSTINEYFYKNSNLSKNRTVSDGKVFLVIEIEYDSLNREQLRSYIDESGEIGETEMTSYHLDGNMTNVKQRHFIKGNFKEEINLFFLKGNLIKKTILKNNGEDGNELSVLKYDNLGNLIEEYFYM